MSKAPKSLHPLGRKTCLERWWLSRILKDKMVEDNRGERNSTPPPIPPGVRTSLGKAMDMKLNIAVLEATDAHAPASICLPWGCTYSSRIGSYLDLLIHHHKGKQLRCFPSLEFLNHGFTNIWGWRSLLWVDAPGIASCPEASLVSTHLMQTAYYPPSADTQNISRHWQMSTALKERAWIPAAVQNHCSSNGNTSYKFFHIPFIMSLRTRGLQLQMSMVSNKKVALKWGDSYQLNREENGVNI